ncbi:MAG: VWA domain-containing protein [Planctomycetes bacterium]|nr:VWA domain-containing protein [Planctomycetota bacterium]
MEHRGSASTTLTGRMVVLVWLISAALHGGGLAIMFSLVFPFASRGQAELPVARLDIVGPVDRPPMAPLPPPDVTDETTTPDPLDARLTPERTDRLSDLATAKRPELSIIGIGAGGGDFSKYGLTAGSGSGPKFFGLGGAARGIRRIVYVVDRSGSMLDTFEHVRVELERSINELRRSQRFHVIFFNSGEPLENPPKRLVSAIKAQKEAFFKFLEGIYPAGSTHPARAMGRAFAAKPDLIYFLTDGAFDPDLVRKLDRWNKGRRVRIFTIAFFDRSGAPLLERIAREHGGEFKFVSENDLP